MASILLWTDELPEEGASDEEDRHEVPFFVKDGDLELSRVPMVGEIVHLGAGVHGAEDYRVVLVRHHREDSPHDAEVYAVRVNFDEACGEFAPKQDPSRPPRPGEARRR